MLVDDHPLWRDTLRNLLEHAAGATVVAEAADGQEAIERARDTDPELVVMDINLPGLDGIEAARRILGDRPTTRMLMLASSDQPAQVAHAVRAGAAGYLLKSAGPDDIVDAVRRIHAGELVFPAGIAEVVRNELRGAGVAAPSVRVAIAVAAVLDRQGLVKVFEPGPLELVACVARIQELEPTDADVLIVDDQPLADAKRLAGDLAAVAPRSNVLLLTRQPDAHRALGLLSHAGVIGYLRADRVAHGDEITAAVERLAAGDPVVDTAVVDDLVDRRQQGSLDRLTRREREILSLMAEGYSNQAISERLYVGQKTVEGHVRNVFTKLGLEQSGDTHRRVLAVIAYLQSAPGA
jgi:DNA-binding NarL/FixJ family response regulator